MQDKQKKDILRQEVDEDEMNSVAGGFMKQGDKLQASTEGNGKCTKYSFYADKCASTVREDSFCFLSSDACKFWYSYDWISGQKND